MMGGIFTCCVGEDGEDHVPLLIPYVPGTVRIIGVAGKAGSGKDTFASLLVHRDGFTRLAFADPLKKALSELFSIPLEHMNHPIAKERINQTWLRSPRQLLQWLGDCARNEIGKDFFVILMAERINASGSQQVVISDVRYEQEAKFIRKMGGDIVELTRENRTTGMGIKESNHSSEKGLPDKLIDYRISNDGSKENLYRIAKNTLTF